MNRLCIYVIYDKDGIVDDYITYFLEAISPFVAHYVIVCNGLLTDKGRAKLSRFTEDIFVRENKGFDAGAVKDALENIYGWEKTLVYDELLIANDTFYGPLFPIDDMFAKMSADDCDFWGITEHKAYQISGTDLILPAHLQSYFINIKRNMFNGRDFRQFWGSLDVENLIGKGDAVLNYEIDFSKFFAERRYKYSTYVNVDSSEMVSAAPENNYNFSTIDAVKLIKEHKCPFVKRHAFHVLVKDILAYAGNERKNELVKIIETTTRYDSALIWDNLLRIADISDIKGALCLQYILPKNALVSTKRNENKTLVIAHLFYADLVAECIGYLKNIPAYCDTIVATSDPVIAERVKEYGYTTRLVSNQGRDTSAFLVGCADLLLHYEYVCFTHDKKSVTNPRGTASFRYLLWENTLGSSVYIENILNKFDSEPRLGFLSVPEPYFADFFYGFHDRWQDNADNARELLKTLGIKVNMDESKSTFAIGNALWCRPKALKQLFAYKWSFEDFPSEPVSINGTISHVIERIYPYVAQYNGYYSGVVMTDNYAEIRNSDMERIVTVLHSQVPLHSRNYLEFIGEKLNIDGDLCENVKKHTGIIVYGTGEYSKYVTDMLLTKGITISMYIVSDGQHRKTAFEGRSVKYLSEVDFADGDCVILALSRYNKFQVKPLLDKAIADSGRDVAVYSVI